MGKSMEVMGSRINRLSAYDGEGGHNSAILLRAY